MQMGYLKSGVVHDTEILGNVSDYQNSELAHAQSRALQLTLEALPAPLSGGSISTRLVKITRSGAISCGIETPVPEIKGGCRTAFSCGRDSQADPASW